VKCQGGRRHNQPNLYQNYEVSFWKREKGLQLERKGRGTSELKGGGGERAPRLCRVSWPASDRAMPKLEKKKVQKKEGSELIRSFPAAGDSNSRNQGAKGESEKFMGEPPWEIISHRLHQKRHYFWPEKGQGGRWNRHGALSSSWTPESKKKTGSGQTRRIPSPPKGLLTSSKARRKNIKKNILSRGHLSSALHKRGEALVLIGNF